MTKMNKWFEEQKLGNIIESEIEKRIVGEYNLKETVERENKYWEERLVLQKRGRVLEKLNEGVKGRYDKEIKECIDSIMMLDILFEECNDKFLCVPNLQCSRLIRRRTGQTSIMFENPDGTVCWMSYVESEASREEKIDYYSPEYLARFDKKEGAIKAASEHIENKADEKSYGERLQEHCDKLDKANRRSEDSIEISRLLDYWREVKMSQLCAGVHADTLTCFKQDLDDIMCGAASGRIKETSDTILVIDELQRISDRVKELRGVENMKEEGKKIDICSCGRGSIGFIVQNNKRVCKDCAKENKVPMSFMCAKGSHICDNAKYAIIGDDNEWYCKEHASKT